MTIDCLKPTCDDRLPIIAPISRDRVKSPEVPVIPRVVTAAMRSTMQCQQVLPIDDICRSFGLLAEICWSCELLICCCGESVLVDCALPSAGCLGLIALCTSCTRFCNAT